MLLPFGAPIFIRFMPFEKCLIDEVFVCCASSLIFPISLRVLISKLSILGNFYSFYFKIAFIKFVFDPFSHVNNVFWSF